MTLKKSDVISMSLATGFIVANIYYYQPLLILIAKEFNISESIAGNITYLTQAGYAFGLFFLVPLGDMFERKKQILFTTLTAIISLFIAATAKSFLILEIACFIIGFSSVVPQLILPLSANLSAPAQKGKVLGTVMSGLLIGILLSRTLSGLIGQLYGWRMVYLIATFFCSGILVLIYFQFPKDKPHYKGTYRKLMGSIFIIIKQEPILRESAIISFFVYMVFGSFWTNMVLLLSRSPYDFQSAKIGLFGLICITGVITALFVGRLGDHINPRIAVGYGLLIMFLSQLLFYFYSTNITLFIIGIALLEIGQYAVHVSNQNRIYSLNPIARNRLNTVFMTMSFIGAALGSAIGLALWKYKGWEAICLASIIMILLATIVYLYTYKKSLKIELKSS